MDETIQRLRDESAKHQTVYEEDRRRKALFAEAADRLSAAEARVKELEGDRDKLRDVLAEAEWGTERCCPLCWNTKTHGHVCGCRLAAVARAAEEARNAQ